MRKVLCLCLLMSALALGVAQAESEHWLHVRVLDGDEKVSVNLPFDMIESVMNHVEIDEFEGGVIQLDELEIDKAMLIEIVDAAKDCKDGNFVTVESPDESVKVFKEGSEIKVEIHDDDETVNVRVPLKVAEALLKGGEDELDLNAALQELAAEGSATLVTIESEDEFVKIWVDSSMEGI